MSACEASWLPALWDGEKEVTAGLGQSSRRGEHVLPKTHVLLEEGRSYLNLKPPQSARGREAPPPAWHPSATKLSCHRSLKTSPSLTPKTEL